jgi:DHA3 family macrolide efflux protein-like MFS transporter
MVVADGAIACFTAVLALLYWLDAAAPWHVYLILFVRALGTAFHDPAMMASTSLMVPKEQLTRVAGLNQTRGSITNIAGPILGALLVANLPIQAILAIDIVTAALAIVPLLFVEIPQPAGHSVTGKTAWDRVISVISETGDGFRYVWNWRGLFIYIAAWSLYPLLGQAGVALQPLWVRDHFGGGSAEWASVMAAISIGSVVGGIMMSTWGGFRRRMTTMVVGAFCFGLANFVRALLPADAFWVFVVFSFLMGPAAVMVVVPYRAILQACVPPDVQGRVFALDLGARYAMGPLGLAVLGPLADTVGVQTMMFLRGVGAILAGLIWFLTPSVRRLEDGPPSKSEPEKAREDDVTM